MMVMPMASSLLWASADDVACHSAQHCLQCGPICFVVGKSSNLLADVLIGMQKDNALPAPVFPQHVHSHCCQAPLLVA
jgi:hypothetical protein